MRLLGEQRVAQQVMTVDMEELTKDSHAGGRTW